MADRIRGQETFISIVRDGVLETQIDSILTSDFTVKLETQEDEYLGEGAPRTDQIYKGVDFKLSGHLTNRRFFDLVIAIRDKAQRRAGSAVRIDVASTWVFPNGDVVSVQAPDVSFSDIPVTTGSRSDFVEWTLDATAADFLAL